MSASNCQHGYEHITDQWGNVRCSNCKQIIAPEPSPAAVEVSTTELTKASKGAQTIAPKYAEFLKQTEKFQSRPRKRKKK